MDILVIYLNHSQIFKLDFRENILLDIVYGGAVVGVTVGGFIMLLWLREQFTIHGGPDWLNDQDNNIQAIQVDVFIRNLIAHRVSSTE